jgi:hypothetical protein
MFRSFKKLFVFAKIVHNFKNAPIFKKQITYSLSQKLFVFSKYVRKKTQIKNWTTLRYSQLATVKRCLRWTTNYSAPAVLSIGAVWTFGRAFKAQVREKREGRSTQGCGSRQENFHVELCFPFLQSKGHKGKSSLRKPYPLKIPTKTMCSKGPLGDRQWTTVGKKRLKGKQWPQLVNSLF